jgi:hypothetical protein
VETPSVPASELTRPTLNLLVNLSSKASAFKQVGAFACIVNRKS